MARPARMRSSSTEAGSSFGSCGTSSPRNAFASSLIKPMQHKGAAVSRSSRTSPPRYGAASRHDRDATSPDRDGQGETKPKARPM